MGGYATRVFLANVRNQLKNKEIVKAAEPRVRKHVARKDLREFSGRREGSGVPEGLQEAECITTKEEQNTSYWESRKMERTESYRRLGGAGEPTGEEEKE
jgi:hypothetical protein